MPREVPSPIVALQEIQLEVRHWLANHEVWFADKKAALRKLSKRNQTDELYEELSRAAGGKPQRSHNTLFARRIRLHLLSGVQCDSRAN
jgi:hypothetical protein